MKTVGAVLIVFASGSVGMKIARQLKQRCDVLRQLHRCLQLLQNEISCYGTQLPQAFALLACASDPPLETIFSNVADNMQRQRWLMPKDAMEIALTENDAGIFDDILRNLAGSLGKYDVQAQLSGIAIAEQETTHRLKQLEEERSIRSKTYKTLGICAGIAAVILLI